MKKEYIRLGMIVEAQESELYPFPLKGYVGEVTDIKDEPHFDGTCIEVGGEHGYWFTPKELKEKLS